MAYDGWLVFNGVEIVNLARTTQIAERRNIDSVWVTSESVEWIQSALYGYDEDYGNVALAPWYDEDHPASSEFAGIVPLSLVGLDDSTREATTIEYLTDGGSSGRSRSKTLPIVASMAIVASTPRGADFGKRWLARALAAEGDGTRTFCSGADLEYFVSRFDPTEDTPPTAWRRDVSLTRGVTVTRKRDTPCSVIWWVTFTLTAHDPFEYGQSDDVVYELGRAVVNLVPNWSFEDGAEGWFGEVGGIVQSDEEAHSGFASGKITTTSGGSSFIRYDEHIYLSGWDFALSAWVNGPAGEEVTLALHYYYEGVWTPLSPATSEVLTGGWQRITAVGSLPSGITYSGLAPAFTTPETGTGYSYFIDDVVMVAGDAPVDVDGIVATPEGPNILESGIISLIEQPCPVYDYTPIYDPLRPALVPPPAIPDFYPAGWTLVPGTDLIRYWAKVKPLAPGSLGVVPTVRLLGPTMRMVRVGIRPLDAPITDQCDPLWEATVTYLPGNQEVVIDGIAQASYVFTGATVRRMDSLVFGPGARPVRWGSISSSTGFLVTVDVLSDSDAPNWSGHIRASVTLTHRSD